MNRRWQVDPTFYIDQTLAAVQETLLAPPPLEEARASELIARIHNSPPILEEAKSNPMPA